MPFLAFRKHRSETFKNYCTKSPMKIQKAVLMLKKPCTTPLQQHFEFYIFKSKINFIVQICRDMTLLLSQTYFILYYIIIYEGLSIKIIAIATTKWRCFLILSFKVPILSRSVLHICTISYIKSYIHVSCGLRLL